MRVRLAGHAGGDQLPRRAVFALELLALNDGAVRPVELLHAANQSHKKCV